MPNPRRRHLLAYLFRGPRVVSNKAASTSLDRLVALSNVVQSAALDSERVVRRLRAVVPEESRETPVKRIIDTKVVTWAVEAAGAELYPNFQPYGLIDTCLAVKCDGWRTYAKMMIAVAAFDAVLAYDLNDVVEEAEYPDDRFKTIYFFPTFEFEEELDPTD